MAPETKSVDQLVSELETTQAQLAELLPKMEAAEAATTEQKRQAAAVKTETERLAGIAADLEAKFGGFEEERAEREAKLAELTERLDGFEVDAKRFGGGGELAETPGEIFTKSDAYTRWVDPEKGGKRGTSRAVALKGLFPGVAWGAGRMAAAEALKTTLLSTVTTDIVLPERIAEIFGPALQMLQMRDLIPVRGTSQSSVQYIRELGFHDATPQSITGITQTAGLATATAAAAHGLRPGERVRVAGADQAGYNLDAWIIQTPSTTTFTYSVDAGTVSPATGTITFQQLQMHGAAGGIAEVGTYPEAELNLETLNAAVEKIGHVLPASEEILSDSAQVRAMVNDRLRFGVLYQENSFLLYGTGTSPQIQGILTADGVQQYDATGDPAADTIIDAIRKGMTRAHMAEYAPTGVVINPQDWETVQLAKGTDDHYLWISVTTGGEQRFFLMPVVVTNAILAGEVLVGSFALASTLWDRQAVEVVTTDSHSDWFYKDTVAIKARERVCHTLYRPDAYVRVVGY